RRRSQLAHEKIECLHSCQQQQTQSAFPSLGTDSVRRQQPSKATQDKDCHYNSIKHMLSDHGLTGESSSDCELGQTNQQPTESHTKAAPVRAATPSAHEQFTIEYGKEGHGAAEG